MRLSQLVRFTLEAAVTGDLEPFDREEGVCLIVQAGREGTPVWELVTLDKFPFLCL